MVHEFEIRKQIDASIGNVLANYLDIEHFYVHPNIVDIRVVSETPYACCLAMKSRILFLPISTVHYFEFRPPHQILQYSSTPLGPILTLATINEKISADGRKSCQINVQVKIDMPVWAYPLRKIVEMMLRRTNRNIFVEDMEILLRRERFFGDNIQDYLRPEQRLLCKEIFKKYYGRHSKTMRKKLKSHR
jgi:hypothetical protein